MQLRWLTAISTIVLLFISACAARPSALGKFESGLVLDLDALTREVKNSAFDRERALHSALRQESSSCLLVIHIPRLVKLMSIGGESETLIILGCDRGMRTATQLREDGLVMISMIGSVRYSPDCIGRLENPILNMNGVSGGQLDGSIKFFYASDSLRACSDSMISVSFEINKNAANTLSTRSPVSGLEK